MELNWDNAKLWQDKVNEKKEIQDEPKWSWDGSLLSINSRFYPPHKNKGDWWEGNLYVVLFGETILTKEFKEDTLEKLHDSVEKYIKHYVGCVKARMS
jgi:hypothetical protein